jgi:SAM-dependent methyltransferase
MEAALDQLKERARKTWAAGDFDDIARMFPDVGPRVAEAAQVEPGMTVLDVACGTGAATIPAAVAGGVCTGLDLIPAMFDAAREHAAEAGVEIEWVEGDAEDLSFDDGSFERVMSQFGVMFAPQHAVAAAELARVTAPGGLIVLASWTPDGMIGDMFKVMGRHLPPPPAGATPPVLWGNEDHVRSLLEPYGVELTFERPMAAFRGGDVEELISRFEANYGPWKMARAAVGDDWPQLGGELYDRFERSSGPASSGGVEALAEYLLVRGRKTS